MSDIRFHIAPCEPRVAYRFTPGIEPTLVFLPGYKSDMSGSKATALFDWAKARGRACLLLDYSGCGASEGEFADGTLSRWMGEVCGLMAHLRLTQVVLVGSSMGGWLMLLVALKAQQSVCGLVGIAAAPDFTQWGFTDDQKASLSAGGTVLEDNPYGPEPTPTHAVFWADGQRHLLLDSAIAIDCPVRLLHGQDDTDVPSDVSLRLAAALRSADVQVTLIKQGDHRLSRVGDIALLLRTVAALVDEMEPV
ncbi:MAG: alpha/beta hydrolase [Novosphingobium sp.]